MTKILVLYHSGTGNLESMARQVSRGVDAVEGCDAVIKTVPSISATTTAIDPDIPAAGALYATHDTWQPDTFWQYVSRDEIFYR